MDRNKTDNVLVLSLHPVGEDSRLATCISPNIGVFTAMVFGARKGKLKSLVSPYHFGKMWLYIDKAKNSFKIQDFDVKNTHPSIRENLYKTCAAALATELIIKTGGVSDSERTFTLIESFLDGLDKVNEYGARTGLLRFIWRYLDHMGLQPDCFSCVTCSDIFTQTPVKMYSASENGFMCVNCATYAPSGLDFGINTEALIYLQLISSQSPRVARTHELSEQAYSELHDLLFFLIENAAESRLKSLEAGKNIL